MKTNKKSSKDDDKFLMCQSCGCLFSPGKNGSPTHLRKDYGLICVHGPNPYLSKR